MVSFMGLYHNIFCTVSNYYFTYLCLPVVKRNSEHFFKSCITIQNCAWHKWKNPINIYKWIYKPSNSKADFISFTFFNATYLEQIIHDCSVFHVPFVCCVINTSPKEKLWLKLQHYWISGLEQSDDAWCHMFLSHYF